MIKFKDGITIKDLRKYGFEERFDTQSNINVVSICGKNCSIDGIESSIESIEKLLNDYMDILTEDISINEFPQANFLLYFISEKIDEMKDDGILYDEVN